MSPAQLEATLRDLPRVGTLIKDRGYRQVWRFEFNGRGYFLKFYPKDGARDWFRRRFRGSPALREFDRLQRLQRAQIPAPRAVAYLAGLNLVDHSGDAVILEAVEPSVQLDVYLNQLDLQAQAAPDHRELSRQVREIVGQLVKAKLGHEDLHLGNFLVHEGKVLLLDGYAVRTRGMRAADLLLLGHSAARFGTRGDLLRGWRALSSAPDAALPPRRNAVSDRIFRLAVSRANGDNRYFGAVSSAGWAGVFYKQAKFPRRWSRASRMTISAADWESAWLHLMGRVERDELEVLKRSRSGDVLAAEITLAGQLIQVIVKRPRRRYWYRYLNEIGRGSRARRAWFKAWRLISRNLPTAWPLIFMEQRAYGYVTDNIIVYERITGPTLAAADLDVIPAGRRDALFRRAGRILRRIEQFGMAHFDAKASNWIVMPDDSRGETPVMIDPDGIRRRRWIALGIERLLRSLRQHPQYTPDDSLALCQGYAPHSRFLEEPAGEDEPTGEQTAPSTNGSSHGDQHSRAASDAPPSVDALRGGGLDR